MFSGKAFEGQGFGMLWTDTVFCVHYLIHAEIIAVRELDAFLLFPHHCSLRT